MKIPIEAPPIYPQSHLPYVVNLSAVTKARIAAERKPKAEAAA